MKFNKNEFGWEEKVSVNTDELVTKNDIPHYNEILKFEIIGEDFSYFMNNSYFNMDALNIDETKLYVGKKKFDINSTEELIYRFVYDKENDVLIDNDSQVYIYNHKSYDGTNFVENENSAVIKFDAIPMDLVVKGNGYFKLYEVEKLELDNNCLSDNVSIVNSLTVGERVGDIGRYSVAEGVHTTASGNFSHAEGGYTTASGVVSHAEGSSTTASGDYSHAEGDSTEASGEASHAEGASTTANGDYSHAEGENTTASGEASHAEGDWTEASGYVSHAEGEETTASGNCSHAEGSYTTASGECSHAEGEASNLATDIIQDLSSSTSNDDILTAWNSNKFSLAKGEASHVEGKDNLALGDFSHAEGNNTTASGYTSHAEGNNTTASGNISHAEGDWTVASGYYSHAEGSGTTASGDYSHAEGKGTKASSKNQHVQGKHNIEDTTNTYAHIVGNGTADNTRSNAHTLDWNGNGWYKGELYTGGTSQSDANKVLTTANISFNESGELVVTIGNVTKTFVPKQ